METELMSAITLFGAFFLLMFIGVPISLQSASRRS
jgi:hypothetical protein